VADSLIYIRERDKQPDCWHPARAVPIAEGVYRITSVPPEVPLEFGVGDRVVCSQRAFPDGSEALLALAAATAG
jgi:hypothetical protein